MTSQPTSNRQPREFTCAVCGMTRPLPDLMLFIRDGQPPRFVCRPPDRLTDGRCYRQAVDALGVAAEPASPTVAPAAARSASSER